MSNKANNTLKQKKSRAVIRLVISIFVLLGLLLNGQIVLSLVFLLVLFVFNELFLADHNFYDPSDDYQYSFSQAEKVQPDWSTDAQSIHASWAKGSYDTALLAINIKHSFKGKFLDPFVTITSGSITRKQYFERSVGGLRYLNISEFINSGEAITFAYSHCESDVNGSEILLFSNETLDDKKVLIIAPHADDAEIGAFGLYSTEDSAIVTVTAGEIGAAAYESAYSNGEQASLQKGRLRSWDSIAIPQWAGLKSDDVIQLGYFCMRLEAMHNAPDEVIASKTAGVNDTRVFREFNTQPLKSDAHGTSSWNSLVADLVECIERIKPDVIVTSHAELDPHPDHYYSTLALQQALAISNSQPANIYFCANHLSSSDMFPFGPVHTLASLWPNTNECVEVGSVVSIPLTIEQQKNKAAALAMMHDLQTPLRWKKKLRFKLQSWLIGRELSPYGEDEYLRIAIRDNELFFSVPCSEFMKGMGNDSNA